MITFPKNLKDFLLNYIKEEFYRGTKRATFIGRPFHDSDLHFFGKGVTQLSDLFTSERAELSQGYLNQPPLRAAYLLYFLPINFAKTTYVLNQFPKIFWKAPRFRVLDLGCGPGSASLAFLYHLRELNPKAEVELILVDQNENILKDARNLIEKGIPNAKFGKIEIKTQRSDIQRFSPSGKYDLILMSHTLNELVSSSAVERAEWLLPRLENHLAEAGIVAITEPALKRPTRELMALRDHLVESKEFTVLAPCLQAEICPMLAATKNDWCHFYLEWEEPEYLKELDRIIKNDNRFLKVAYLLLGWKNYFSKNLPKIKRNMFRVVSNRMAASGKTEVVLCGPPGRLRISLFDRDRSPSNEALGYIHRGDLLELPDYDGKGYEVDRNFKLSRKSLVKQIREKI